MHMELTHLTLAQAAAALQNREISAVALLHTYLKRIEARNPRLNAYITITIETAEEEARQADALIAAGNYRGPLHGIPLALKDLYETAGVTTTAGSLFFKDHIPEMDSFLVSRLKDAGAVLLGKLNMHEIALGVTNENPHYGVCRNPWNPEHISGGSSGGSAAAVSAGLCLGSLGSDTGGSIRIPASLCGVVGLKPTFGRLSLRGVIPLSWNLDHPGTLTRSVEDAALMLQVLACFDQEDPNSVNHPIDDYLSALKTGVGGWRVALAVDDFFQQADPEVLEAFHRAAALFSDLGAQVEEVALPEARQYAQSNGLMVTSDAAAYHQERLQKEPQGFGADVLARLQAGAAFTSSEYALARRIQSQARRRFEKLFEEYQVLLTPATPMAAPLLDSATRVERARQLTAFTAPFNLSGLPAMVLPCGFSTAGLPIGLQIISKPWGEALVLSAAYAYEQIAGWKLDKPLQGD
jgi:aspartyl-tRNA(Asn)/glutamyl-tRNA(Gln) amidotransferase subunit A